MKMSKRTINICIFLAIVVATIFVDQITKYCFEGMEKSLIGNFLWISWVDDLNSGAAFSMLSDVAWAKWLFISVGIITFLAIVYVVVFKKISQDYLFVVALSLVGGGVVGNVIDRIVFGAVRDFIDFRFSGFAIFNFADSFLCIGCALLVLWVIIASVRDSKKKKVALKGEAGNDN